MISHWDDVARKRHEYGELRSERRALSRPRGSRSVTLSMQPLEYWDGEE